MGAASQCWGRSIGRADRRWELVREADGFRLVTTAGERRFTDAGIEQIRPVRRWLRPVIEIAGPSGTIRLRGLSRQRARELDSAISATLARLRAAEPLRAAVDWHRRVTSCVDGAQRLGRWIPMETVHELADARPGVDPRAWFEGPEAVAFAESLRADEMAALKLMHQDLAALVGEVNESIVQSERQRHAQFFDTVETSPLTEEQARAVIVFDNRVQVIASAGSGKTSVMVARAAYAIARGIVPPDGILLLAFNRNAAEELQQRLEARLSRLGLSSAGLRASTFHSFGLEVIGRATGRKPRPAPWLDGGQDVGVVSRIIDELRDRSPHFRYKWDLFRLLYSRASDTPDADGYDGWDREQRRSGFTTFAGDVVKSESERMIADWLYLNGVDYRYEHAYLHDVATESHSQYRPDFYYPQVDVWHEHWALGHDGKPPEAFEGYEEGMRWKQQLHRQHGTTLVETTWAEIIDGRGFDELGRRLIDLGLTLDWNPDRPIRGATPPRHEDLARLTRSFMTHVKSGGWTREQVEARCVAAGPHRSNARTRIFLDLYWQIHDEWEARLTREGYVDFEDMLVRAAEHLEAGESSFDHTLVMVDEFQDVSRARARLTRALVAKPGRYLLTVGDDWQSINRFAGADLSVMTHFDSWFGASLTLRLQTTFRCPQSICDVSSEFVMKNQQQLTKAVRSARPGYGAPVKVLFVDNVEQVPGAIAAYLEHLSSERVEDGADPLRVDVLGRYGFDRDLMPTRPPAGVDVRFRTVHGSKGLEADCIVLPNLTRGAYGFPSEIADDPLLDLVMAEPEGYPFAEERRLLYVALTRAKREVVLIAVRGRESVFVRELVEHPGVETTGDGEDRPAPVPCPGCGSGFLVLRRGPYGDFYGCSTFPACRQTARAAAPPAAESRS